MKRAMVSVLALLLIGCSNSTSASEPLVELRGVSAMHQLPNGHLRVGIAETGEIWDVDASGRRGDTPFARVEASTVGERGILGLTVDDKGRTFASWWKSDGAIVVADVTSGVRVVWNGTTATENVGGTLAMTPTGRLLIGLGDLGRPQSTADPNDFAGKLLTLDPDRESEQLPNAISSGWTNPKALAFDQGGNLWVADQNRNGVARLTRAGTGGAIGQPTQLRANTAPIGLVAYSQQEMVLCSEANSEVARFLLQDALAIPGRILVKGCTGPMARLDDGRLAFATSERINLTER